MKRSPHDNTIRSAVAAALSGVSAVVLGAAAFRAWKSSRPVALALAVTAVSGGVLAGMAARASILWRSVAIAGRPRAGVLPVVALSDADEHMIYASLGGSKWDIARAKAELHAAQEMPRDRTH